MRQKYVELIKDFINKTPDYKLTIKEIQANIVSVGATEEEFNEALRQLMGLAASEHLFQTDDETLKKQLEETQQELAHTKELLREKELELTQQENKQSTYEETSDSVLLRELKEEIEATRSSMKQIEERMNEETERNSFTTPRSTAVLETFKQELEETRASVQAIQQNIREEVERNAALLQENNTSGVLIELKQQLEDTRLYMQTLEENIRTEVARNAEGIQYASATGIEKLQQELEATRLAMQQIETQVQSSANRPSDVDLKQEFAEIRNHLKETEEKMKWELHKLSTQNTDMTKERMTEHGVFLLQQELRNTHRLLKQIEGSIEQNSPSQEEFENLKEEVTNATELLQKTSHTVHQDTPIIAFNGRKITKNSLRKAAKSKKALAVAAACILLFMGVQYSSIQQQKKVLSAQIQQHIYQKGSDNSIIPPVYASAQSVDGQKVFSFPQKAMKLAIPGTPKKKVIGFLPYWLLDEEDKINLDDITTVSLFGIEMDGKGNIVTTNDDGSVDGGWSMWNDSKLDDFITRAKRKHLKVVLTIKSFNNDNIAALSTNDDAQKTLISNMLYMVNEKNLDGVNLDFEYVGTPDPKIRDGFSRLVKNVNAALNQQVPNADLTVDTYVNAAIKPGLFDIESLADNSDDLVVMGYDIHTPSGDPGPVAPMLGDLNISTLIEGYLDKVSPDKIILAVPYYGYDWVVQGNVPTLADGTIDSSQNTVVPYAQIAAQSSKYKIQWDTNSLTPYYDYKDASGQLHEVHFDNVRSLSLKYDFINRKNLDGVGIWALGYDGLNTDLQQLLNDKFTGQ